MSRITGNSLVMGGVLMVVSVLLMYCPVFAQTDSLRRKVEAAYLNYDTAAMNWLLQEWHRQVKPKPLQEFEKADQLERWGYEIYNAYLRYDLETAGWSAPYRLVQDRLLMEEVVIENEQIKSKHTYKVTDFRPDPGKQYTKLLYTSDSQWRTCTDLHEMGFNEMIMHLGQNLRRDSTSLFYNRKPDDYFYPIDRMLRFLSDRVSRPIRINYIQVNSKEQTAVIVLENRYDFDCISSLTTYEEKILLRYNENRWEVVKEIKTYHTRKAVLKGG